MPELFCVRANNGQYTEQFLNGRYVAIGWLAKNDLSKVKSYDELKALYVKYHLDDTSELVIGQQVGQIERFLFGIKPGDYVITPAKDTDFIHYGVVRDEPYYYGGTEDGCPFLHRRKVDWHKNSIRRAEFSVPFQNTIRSSLTVYSISRKNVSHKSHFFEVIGKKEFVSKEQHIEVETHKVVLKRLLELNADEFELLVTELLTAIGFEAEHTGKVGDGGVDAKGELNIDNIAKIKIYVQAKRYQVGSKIDARTVKALRQNIPRDEQGVFITTADFQGSALEAASENGFPRIGTINGTQLVDLLTKHWDDLPQDLRDNLGLKKGLIAG
ncbi:MAG: hypothetical protein A2787_05720 [Omnitrophica WOR_2 bacterium RIFCSPHIGHO2_01_FULL_48_9]|nr:MAG: hypothetical protein A3D10_08915 [Omnitrophica WOR_2 bacterium RIFCSPHIGHO2_02_FULL_48_11]OGX30646.1 MAG: hypothetical protein A2787_05720 [Omnitrophica WOR_2 bacterium RIFCSPHIGHO2_01_FULL_48_9]